MRLFIEVKLKGGLGNQLFQYATARCLAVKQRIPWLLLNTDNYRKDAFGREFGLGNLRIKGAVLRSAVAKRIFQKGSGYNRIVSLLPLYSGIEEAGLRVHHFPAKLGVLSSITGYWQSEFYFREIRALLMEECVPKQIPASPDWILGSETVAVHIRRTDYLAQNGFGTLSGKYYKEAMGMIRSKVQDPVFVFFSDDLEWCRRNFPERDFRFCDEPEWRQDYLQLYLMSKCRHQIIANSSFSWWGAWLNANPAKCVIRPERPFLDNSLQYEAYYPADWIPLRNEFWEGNN